MTTLPRIAAALALIAIVFVTLCPVGLRPQTGDPMLARTVTFFLFGGLATLAFPGRMFQVLLGVVVMAVGLELLQLVDPSRDARLIDAAVKVAGGVAGVLVTHAVGSLKRRSA